jgi:hypothetical protein
MLWSWQLGAPRSCGWSGQLNTPYRRYVRQLGRLPTGSSASRTGASARAWRAVRLQARGGLRQLEQAPAARGGNVCVSRGIRLGRHWTGTSLWLRIGQRQRECARRDLRTARDPEVTAREAVPLDMCPGMPPPRTTPPASTLTAPAPCGMPARPGRRPRRCSPSPAAY